MMDFEQKTEQMKAKYRAVFSSPLGREVFADMLMDLGEPALIPADPAMVALKNYAEHLWACCGVRDDINAVDYVSAMFRIERQDGSKKSNAKGDNE